MEAITFGEIKSAGILGLFIKCFHEEIHLRKKLDFLKKL
jgi:hypothetical protein